MKHLSASRGRPSYAIHCCLLAIGLLCACASKKAQRALGGSLAVARDASAGVLVAPTELPLPRQPLTLPMAGGGLLHVQASLLSVAAAGGAGVAQAAPLFLVLHGMCGDPRASCAAWSSAGPQRRWLLCPSGDVPCEAGFDWSRSQRGRAARVARAISLVRRGWGSRVDDRGAVLVGFSRGAFVARDVVYAQPGRYRGLVLVGAAIALQAARLQRAGVRRVVLACGEHDGARMAMLQATAGLQRAGMQARFVSTGPIWHQLPPDLDAVLGDALAWVAGA